MFGVVHVFQAKMHMQLAAFKMKDGCNFAEKVLPCILFLSRVSHSHLYFLLRQ